MTHYALEKHLLLKYMKNKNILFQIERLPKMFLLVQEYLNKLEYLNPRYNSTLKGGDCYLGRMLTNPVSSPFVKKKKKKRIYISREQNEYAF